MEKEKRRKASKFLSYVLRHHPEEIDLELDMFGYAEVDELIEKCRDRFALTADDLRQIMQEGDKQRFAFDAEGRKIRATHGHSIPVKLVVPPSEPPEFLYHGTSENALLEIMGDGIKPMARSYVHLSKDKRTAKSVGSRHGKPVILLVKAKEMYEKGAKFYLVDEGHWLTEYVEPEFFEREEGR